MGCYLIDLCPEPVDHLEAASRRIACRNAEVSLSKAIARLRPPVIATLVRSIERNVLNAAEHAHWSGTMIHLPYPGRWSRLKKTFHEMLRPAILQLERQNRNRIPPQAPRGAPGA